MISRMLRASMLDAHVYEEVESDSSAIVQAVLIVVIVAVAKGVATLSVTDNILGTIGLNLFLMALVVYFFQGLSIIIFFLESRNVPVFFWVLIFFVIIFQPLLIGASIGLGIFDIWLDMRKVRANGEQNSG